MLRIAARQGLKSVNGMRMGMRSTMYKNTTASSRFSIQQQPGVLISQRLGATAFVRSYTTTEATGETAAAAAEAATTTATSVSDAVNQVVSPENLSEAAAKIGDFKAMGLCNFTPVGGLEAMLEAVHVYTGMPWWGTIATATVLVRLALLPLMIKIQRNNAKMMNLNPEVSRLMSNLKTAQQDGDSVAVGKYTNEMQGLFKKHGCHPMKSLGLPIIQMPVMVSFFLALRAMAELPVPGMTTGGLGWFTDLTAQDPYYILPAVSAAGVMAVLEAGTEVGAANPQSRGMKNFFRVMAVAMVPFTYWMPSSVFVYWITSNAVSIAQILTLKNPAVRKALDIPKLVKPAAELQKNQKGFWENFKEQTKHHEKLEKERALRERQRAAVMARRAAKRRF